jgi:hypothetical protein
MSPESLMLISGSVVLAQAVLGGRQRRLREKYVLAWAGVGLVQIACALLSGLDVCGLNGTATAVLVGLTALYVFSFAMSVSLSHLCRQNVRLNQEVALLEHRLYDVEAALTPRTGRRFQLRIADRPHEASRAGRECEFVWRSAGSLDQRSNGDAVVGRERPTPSWRLIAAQPTEDLL